MTLTAPSTTIAPWTHTPGKTITYPAPRTSSNQSIHKRHGETKIKYMMGLASSGIKEKMYVILILIIRFQGIIKCIA